MTLNRLQPLQFASQIIPPIPATPANPGSGNKGMAPVTLSRLYTAGIIEIIQESADS